MKETLELILKCDLQTGSHANQDSPLRLGSSKGEMGAIEFCWD